MLNVTIILIDKEYISQKKNKAVTKMISVTDSQLHCLDLFLNVK